MGNSSLQTFNWGSTTAYYGDKWEPFIDLQQTFTGGGTIKTNRQSYGYLTTNYYLTGHLFIYPWLSGLKATESDLGYGSAIQSGGGVGWASVPAQWTASFWTTIEAAGNAAKYGETFEHTAERALMYFFYSALLGEVAFGLVVLAVVRRIRNPPTAQVLM